MKRAVAFLGVGQVGVLEMELPPLLEGEVLVRSEFTAISPGTELRCLAGQQPGSLDFPFVPGYAMVGVVEEAGAGVLLPVGTRVFGRGSYRSSLNLMWGGHVSHAVTTAEDLFVMPDGCSGRLASLAKIVAIASRGVTMAKPQKGEKVAVVGLGPIGLLSARLFALAGADVLGVDLAAERLEMPAKSGLSVSQVTSSTAETVRQHFGQGADIVVDATGVPAALPGSMVALRDLGWGETAEGGAKLVIQGSYAGDFTLPYQESFVKELTILMPRDARPSDVTAALILIESGAIRVDDLISWEGKPEDAPEAYRLLKEDRSKLTGVFDWS